MKDSAIRDLLYRKYVSCMAPILPDSVMPKGDFTASIFSGLKDLRLIDIKDACPEKGFLYYQSWQDEITHCRVPAYGFYAEDEKTAVMLFQKLAETVVKETPCDFSVRLYHNDSACINAFHMMQFGTVSERSVAATECSCEAAVLPVPVRALSKEEISVRWEEVWRAVGQIIEHLRQSPVFYPGREFTEDLYREFLSDNGTTLLAAEDNGKIAGIMEWNREKNEMLAPCCESVNVGEAFVYPEYRGTGLAGQLLYAAKRQAYLAGARYMWVEHGTANPNARGFWNKYFTTYAYELARRVERPE